MFQFPALTPSKMVTGLQPVGLPHSEMSGSKVVCTYPSLIAAYHVLHRLPEPRHPPFALSFFFYVKLLVLRYGLEVLEVPEVLDAQPLQIFYIVNLIFRFAREVILPREHRNDVHDS